MRDNPILQVDPVLDRSDGIYVRVNGCVHPVISGGQAVRSFNEGWRATHLFSGFSPMLLLVLRHESGDSTTWYLDHRLHMVSNTISGLTPALSAALRHRAVPIVAGLFEQVATRCKPVLTDLHIAFLALPEGTRRDILALVHERLVETPTTYGVGDLANDSLSIVNNEGRPVFLQQRHLIDGFSVDWQERLTRSFRDRQLTWPSPADGAAIVTQGALAFDDFHFAFRFADLRNDFVFFVVVADHSSRVAGIWIPSAGVMIGDDRTDFGLTTVVGAGIASFAWNHLCQKAGLIVPYLDRSKDGMVSIMRGIPGMHIGHQLWNELSGLDRLIHRQPDPVPRVIVVSADAGTEAYGAVDEIFPLLHGHVERNVRNWNELSDYLYARNLVPCRVTSEFVSDRLRQRILALAGRDARVPIEVRTAPGPKIVFGLRVENRTFSDLGGFIDRFIDHLETHHPGTTLVFDGHNASTIDSGKPIESHGESLARRSPMDVEREIVARARLRATHQGVRSPTIIIADTIGYSMADGLATLATCDAFVSIWGASLAKYRWICNLPGYIISNAVNLARPAVHIYSDERYMERPTQTRFIDAALVTDEPDAEQLVAVSSDPGLYNFSVDIPATLRDISSFLNGLRVGASSP